MAGPLAASGRAGGRRLGGALVAGMGATLARGAKRTGLVAGVAAGAAIVTGIQSGLDQQRAQATLTGLYGTATDAAFLMKEIRDISRSSPIDYSAYLKAGEAFGYMGVNSSEVPGILENMGKAIVGVGGGSTHIDRASDALLKMVNQGRVYAADLNQLSDTGIPIIDALATHYGVTNEELKKMVTEGKVGVEDVIQVLKDADSPVFTQVIASGENVAKTLPAQFQILKGNVSDTLGTMMQPAMGGLARYLRAVNAWFTAENEAKAAAKVRAAMGGVRAAFVAAGSFVASFRAPAVNAFNAVSNAVALAYARVRQFFASDLWASIKLDTIRQFARIWGTLRNTFRGVWEAIQGLLPSVGVLGATFARAAGALGVTYWGLLLRIINLLLPVIGTVLVASLKALSGILSGVAGWLNRNTWAVQALILAYTGWKIIGLVASLTRMTIALAANTAGLIRNTAASVANLVARARSVAQSGILIALFVRDAAVKAASTAATVANTVATRAQALGRVALNAAMVAGRALWTVMTTRVIANTAATVANTVAARAAAIGRNALNAAMVIGRGLWLTTSARVVANTAATAANAVATRAAAIGRNVLNAAMAIGRGLWAVVTARVIANSAATVANAAVTRAAALGHAVLRGAMVAGRAAMAALTLAQIRLNIAVLANPYVAIGVAIAAFIAAIVLAWRNSETFRRIVTAAWNGIKAAAVGAWNGFIRPAIMGFWRALQTLWGIAVQARNVIVAAWGAIRAGIGAAWNWVNQNVILPWRASFVLLWRAVVAAKNFVVAAWNLIRSGLAAAWRWIFQNVIMAFIRAGQRMWRFMVAVKNGVVAVWNALRNALGVVWRWLYQNLILPWIRNFQWVWDKVIVVKNGVLAAFNLVRNGLGAAWRWIRDNAINPLRRGFQWVWDKAVQIKNGLVDTFNKMRQGVARAFNRMRDAVKKPINAVIRFVNDKIIGEENGKGGGLNAVTTKFNLKIPNIPTLNKGGVVPGYGPDKDSVLTHLTPGESVFTRKRTRELGGPAAVDAINRQGWGAAAGGASGRDRRDGTDAMGGWGDAMDWIGEAPSKIWNMGKAVTAGTLKALQTDPGRLAFAAFEKVLPIIEHGLQSVTGSKPAMAGQFVYGVFQELKGYVKDWILGEDEKEASLSLLDFIMGSLPKGRYGGTVFDLQQVGNAMTIMAEGQRLGATGRDIKIALMTAMQESMLRNINYGHLDSLGLFQQRNAWGPASHRTNPRLATRMFFRGGQAGQPGLFDIKGRNKMSLTAAAQAVQRSAFPGAYAKWADEAQALIDAARKVSSGGRAGQVASGRIMKRGTYRIGRGSAAHGYAARDLPAPTGTPVYAPWSGRIARRSLTTSYGKHFRLTGGHGITFLGAHLSRHQGGGGRVRQGQVIGRVGSTGNSTGPHLHVEALRGGRRLNPDRYLKYDQGGYLPKGHSLVYNGTGGRERVLDRRETEAYEKGQRGATFNIYGSDKQLVSDVKFALRAEELSNMTAGV